MSDLDDLEEISEQFRYGVNDPKRIPSQKVRVAFIRSAGKNAKKANSVEKQQQRSTDRRRVLVTLPNQE